MFDIKKTIGLAEGIVAGPFIIEENANNHMANMRQADEDRNSHYEIVPHVESGEKDFDGNVIPDQGVDLIKKNS